MEALIAVGLASNVVQFLDFGIKLVKNAKELYSSVDSRTRRHADLELVKNDLEKLIVGLKPQASTDPSFQDLITKCVQVSTELQDILEKLRLKKGRHVLWSTCVVAFKTSWSESQLQELTTKLHSLRDELQFQLIVKLSGQASSIDGVDFGLLRNAADNVQRLCRDYPAVVKNLDSIGKEIIENVRLQRKALTDTERHLEGTLQRFHLETTEKLDSIQSDVQGLRNALWNSEVISCEYSTLIGSQSSSSSDDDLVQTFWYRGIEDRYDDVELAHMGTFRWILNFDDHIVDKLCVLASSFEKNRPHSNFGRDYSRLCEYAKQFSHQRQVNTGSEWDPCSLIQWLRRGENVFWITGKPGSGKSTIMKYIGEDPIYQTLVSEWAGTNLVLSPSFFFWRAGSSIQKSQQGLLLSLLYQIFEAHPQLMHKVIGKGERDAALAKKNPIGEEPYWTLREAKRLFERLVALNGINFCLLIDGLDEFDGETYAIASFFQRLGQMKNVKILLSGRYLTEFQNAFQNIIIPLHDWTRHDIESYIRGRLSENQALQDQAQSRKAEFAALVIDLLNKADGVFVWVKTAVSTLLSGLRDYDTVEEIISRLRELPSELDDLYETILRSIDHRHLDQTRFYLALLLSFHGDIGRPDLIDIGFAMQYNSDNVRWGLEHCETNVEAHIRTTRGRLESRCPHLLSIRRNLTSGTDQVLFMHRTVIDFLSSSKGQNLLAQSDMDNEFVKIASTMGAAQFFWFEWKNRDESDESDDTDLLEGLQFFDFHGLLERPWSRSARQAVEQVHFALQEWSQQRRIISVSGIGLPQVHIQCTGKSACQNFRQDFLPRLWNKYWLMRSHIAIWCLWSWAGNPLVVCEMLDYQKDPLNTLARLDMMTVAILPVIAWEGREELLDRFCSQDSAFPRLFWHRMFNLIDCQVLDDKIDRWEPLPSFIDTLITHGVNPNQSLQGLAFARPEGCGMTALEILQKRGASCPPHHPLWKAIKALETASAIRTGRWEEGVYEHEWEIHWFEKECFDYCKQERLSFAMDENDDGDDYGLDDDDDYDLDDDDEEEQEEDQ